MSINWVKAAVELTLSRVATMGAMAIDEFLEKMRAVFREITTSDSLSKASLSLPDRCPVAGVPVAGVPLACPVRFLRWGFRVRVWHPGQAVVVFWL